MSRPSSTGTRAGCSTSPPGAGRATRRRRSASSRGGPTAASSASGSWACSRWSAWPGARGAVAGLDGAARDVPERRVHRRRDAALPRADRSVPDPARGARADAAVVRSRPEHGRRRERTGAPCVSLPSRRQRWDDDLARSDIYRGLDSIYTALDRFSPAALAASALSIQVIRKEPPRVPSDPLPPVRPQLRRRSDRDRDRRARRSRPPDRAIRTRSASSPAPRPSPRP